MNDLGLLSSWYFDQQLPFDKKLIKFRYLSIKPHFEGTSLLEMGPAEGVMTQLLCKDFKEIHVVDGSKHLLDLIPQISNVTRFHSFFEEFVPPIKYNTIIMEHVLEHIEYPQRVLSRVKTWLRNKNSKLIVGVPNAKSIHRMVAVKMGLLSSEYELNERDKSLGHYRVYDMATLKEQIEAAGFKVVYEGGVFLKPLSNKQIEDGWTEEMIMGFFELGKDFIDHSAEIFIVATV